MDQELARKLQRRARRGRRGYGVADQLPWNKEQARLFAKAGYENWATTTRLGAISAIRQIAARSPLAQAYLSIMRLNVVGHQAPTPTFSSVQSAKDRSALKKLWAKWACDPSVNGGDDLAALLRALLGSMLTDGRVFAILRRNDEYTCGLGVMPLERDWLADNGEDSEQKYRVAGRDYTGVNGIIRSPAGRISHYIFYGDPMPGDVIKERWSGYAGTNVIRHSGSGHSKHALPADMVADLYCPRNAADYEGNVSHLLPILRKLQEIARLDNAMIQSMEISAKKMGFIQREIGSSSLDELQKEDPDQMPPPTEFEASVIEELPAGYTFASFNPDAPNADISRYRLELIMNAAAALNLDHASLAGDLRDVNYSSIRHGMVQAREGYRMLQGELERRVLRPMLAKLLSTARMRGELSITEVSYERALMSDWRHRTWSWIDPVNDVQAATLAVQLGVDSPQRIAAATGKDFENLMIELADAAKKMKKAGLHFVAMPDPKPALASPAKGKSAKAPATMKAGNGKSKAKAAK